MKRINQSGFIRNRKPYIKFVWACAWCSPDKHKPLAKGQEYTHGICTVHKQQLLTKYHQSKLDLGHSQR